MRLYRQGLILVAFLFAWVFLKPSSSLAGLDDKVSSPNYAVRAPSRLFQGIVNFSLGWSTFLTEPIKSTQSEGDSFKEGVFRGLSYPISYTILGAYDIGTFWVPNVDKLGTDVSKVHKNVLNL